MLNLNSEKGVSMCPVFVQLTLSNVTALYQAVSNKPVSVILLPLSGGNLIFNFFFQEMGKHARVNISHWLICKPTDRLNYFEPGVAILCMLIVRIY